MSDGKRGNAECGGVGVIEVIEGWSNSSMIFFFFFFRKEETLSWYGARGSASPHTNETKQNETKKKAKYKQP